MDRFIRSQNVERYRHLLESKTEEPMRQTILKLLAEEQQKQKDTGDSIFISLVEKTAGHG